VTSASFFSLDTLSIAKQRQQQPQAHFQERCRIPSKRPWATTPCEMLHFAKRTSGV